MAGTGESTTYLAEYDTLRSGLEASGEVHPLEVAGLALARTAAKVDAALDNRTDAYPVVLLSPGNATNVGFYAALAEELASHGYVVIGIDHPYQVAAADIGGGRVAVYEPDDFSKPIGEMIARKIDERIADVGAVLDALRADAAGISLLAGRLDLERIAIAGHSNGGVTAAEVCARDPRVSACLNIDGQHAGGPFSTRPGPVAPTVPFMYLTKEADMHPAIEALFDAASVETFRVVIHGVTHDDFADGARFRPRVLPVDGAADYALTTMRSYALAFLDHVLRGAPASAIEEVRSPLDVRVQAFLP